MMNGVRALDRQGHALDDRLSRRHAQRAALESEILDGDRDALPLERSESQGDRIGGAGIGAVLLQAIRVPLDVAELERVGQRLRRGDFLVSRVVEQRGEAGLGADRHVVAGAGNHHEVGFQILVEDELTALGAFDPEIVRALPAQERPDFRRHDVGDPVHGIAFLYRVGEALLPVLQACARSSTRPAIAGTVAGLATPS